MRTGRDPREMFAIGDAAVIMHGCGEYVAAAPPSSFCGRSRMGMPDMLAQTRRLVEEVLPAVAARWPRRPI